MVDDSCVLLLITAVVLSFLHCERVRSLGFRNSYKACDQMNENFYEYGVYGVVLLQASAEKAAGDLG